MVYLFISLFIGLLIGIAVGCLLTKAFWIEDHTGRWNMLDLGQWRCNNCGHRTERNTHSSELTAYCPDCGAKMENGGKN